MVRRMVYTGSDKGEDCGKLQRKLNYGRPASYWAEQTTGQEIV